MELILDSSDSAFFYIVQASSSVMSYSIRPKL